MLDKLYNMSILSEKKVGLFYGTVKQILYSNELIHLFKKNIIFSKRTIPIFNFEIIFLFNQRTQYYKPYILLNAILYRKFLNMS